MAENKNDMEGTVVGVIFSRIIPGAIILAAAAFLVIALILGCIRMWSESKGFLIVGLGSLIFVFFYVLSGIRD